MHTDELEAATQPTTTTTLSELGFELPVGTEPATGADVRGRAFAFKSWRASDERVVGAMRDKDRSMTQGSYVAAVLAHFLTEWGHHDFASMDAKSRRLVLNQSFAADVFAAWMQLRRQVLGDECTIDVACTACRAQFGYDVQLGTVEVRTLPDGTRTASPFSLRDGFEWRGELRKAGILRPVRWAVYESLGKGGGSINVGEMKLALLASAVSGLAGVEGALHLPSAALDLTKYDLETLTLQVDETQPGPDLSIEDKCPECGTDFRRTMPWTYDAFFSVRSSSRGAPRGE